MTLQRPWIRVCRDGLVLLPGVLAMFTLAGCGKKGPPLAPLMATPARIVDVQPRRMGESVYVRVKVPDTNLDGTVPADLDRVEVYAFTGFTQTDIRDLKYATHVGTIQVQRVYSEDERRKFDEKGVKPPETPGAPQGGFGVVVETLTPEALVPVTPMGPKEKKGEPPPLEGPLAVALASPMPEKKPLRFYAALGFSRKKVKGPNSPRPTIALDPPASAPRAGRIDFTETEITLAWEPPAEQRAPIQAPAEGTVLPGKVIGGMATTVFAYNVYAAERLGGTAPASAGATPVATPARPSDVEPLNEKPLAELAFTRPIEEPGRERCFVVRAVHLGVESAPTEPLCVTPFDRYAPAAPTSLAAIASEGAISLIWEGVDAADLAGYLVLRGEGPNAIMRPLFETPIRDTSYRDATAKTGVRYAYAVVAVDTATPRNLSGLSNRVEETAR